VVDSRLVSMALGLVVLAAADMAERGLDAPEIVARVSALCPKVRALFIVDTLEYLHRGGRIGGAERFLGSMLSIKPLLQIADGRVEALEKTRTKQRALVRLLEVMGGWIGSASRLQIAVAHADALEDALHLKAEIETRFRQPVSYVCEFTPVVGVHGGPGLFGATFYAEE
jgi:DegV family protein with EDD domain